MRETILLYDARNTELTRIYVGKEVMFKRGGRMFVGRLLRVIPATLQPYKIEVYGNVMGAIMPYTISSGHFYA